MHGTTLQERAAERAQELPGAELTHPFGEDWDVYKVRGKVFMLATAVTQEPVVVLKAAPADARSLREAHEDVSPGYHMNKKHWNSVRAGLDPNLMRELIEDSYDLVVDGMPRRDKEYIRLQGTINKGSIE